MSPNISGSRDSSGTLHRSTETLHHGELGQPSAIVKVRLGARYARLHFPVLLINDHRPIMVLSDFTEALYPPIVEKMNLAVSGALVILPGHIATDGRFSPLFVDPQLITGSLRPEHNTEGLHERSLRDAGRWSR